MQPTRFDVIWGRVRSILLFFGGLGIMAYETLKEQGDRPYLYAVAVGMMGLQAAGAVEDFFRARASAKSKAGE